VRPLPPWGRVRGLNPHDCRILQDLADTLDHHGGSTIIVPSPRQPQRDPLNVRILSEQQAISRLELPTAARRLDTEWIVTDRNAEHPLVCCWHDDSMEEPEEGDERAYVPYLINLLKAKERLLRDE